MTWQTLLLVLFSMLAWRVWFNEQRLKKAERRIAELEETVYGPHVDAARRELRGRFGKHEG